MLLLDDIKEWINFILCMKGEAGWILFIKNYHRMNLKEL